MDTALKVPYVKNPGVDGFDFDLLPRKGVHTEMQVHAAKRFLFDTQRRISDIRVTWLPKQSETPYDYDSAPHLLVRIQNPSGGLNPFKRAVWASIDVEEYNIRISLYDGTPDEPNLLPNAQITFSDGKFMYTLTSEELAFILASDKTIRKKKLK
ncbi:hypothetical protein LCGC14_2015380 [marine sediment metagenome]|uniref:Uncharacterized protein n=1 Tax=marine sediment metagenome TaxID=412755 RepID=A0A0F9HCG9_9ZZZZ|nr:hypothetical protein [Candidatus Scalindua sp.]